MAEVSQLKGKRKKKLSTNPNPLFIKWLKEWAAEAEEKGKKNAQFNYNKAIRSMKKYPLPLRSGKDCLLLESFGKKTCDMLDEKLAAYAAEKGINIKDVFDAEEKISKVKPIQKRKRPNNKPIQKEQSFHVTVHTISSSDSDEPGQTGKDSSQTNSHPDISHNSLTTVTNLSQSPTTQKSSPRGKQKEYTPKYRSGGYAVLVTLLRSQKDSMSKQELIDEAQPLSDTSFKSSSSSSYYTAWSSVGTLVKKALITKKSSPAKYSLTDDGRALALKLSTLTPEEDTHTQSCPESNNEVAILAPKADQVLTNIRPLPTIQSLMRPQINVSHRNESVNKTTKSSFQDIAYGCDLDKAKSDDFICIDDAPDNIQCFDLPKGITSPDVIFYPGTFDIVLCVDNCEFYGGSNTCKNILNDLMKNGVDCQLKKLHVGDFLWVAQERSSVFNASSEPRELVLNYIVERKRMDDLSSSIIDGRFREQKFRLKQCGLTNAIYLIEHYGSAKHCSVSEDKLKQAITNTQVIDGFRIKITQNEKESVAYLTLMTRYLQSCYSGKTLYGINEVVRAEPGEPNVVLESSTEVLCNFEDFNKSAIKSKSNKLSSRIVGNMHNQRQCLWQHSGSVLTEVLTVREMFAKQLMHLPNMSSAKAFAITEIWPTPACLFKAYSSRSTKVSQEQMLNNIKFGKAKRNLGPILSARIQQYYCHDG